MFVGGRRLASLAVGLAVALLAGCSGSSESPRTLPPLSTTPAASASTSPPQDPKAAAVAVVREYFRLLNAPTTLATAQHLRMLMTAACTCRKVATSTAQVAKRGQHYFGHTRATSITPNVEASTADVLVDYNYTETGIAKSDGSVVSRSPGRMGASLDFKLQRSGSRWLIDALIYIRKGRVE